MLAVSMLLFSSQVEATATCGTTGKPACDYSSSFTEASEQGAPLKTMNANEFKQYYYLMNRGNTPNADRGIYFSETDTDNNEELSKEEIDSHE
jgi:hypothetical protein